MKIAIFGGAFNPVHREHVHLARTAIDELGLDKLIIMPTAISPHKRGKAMADFFQRFEMCRLAFRELKQAEVSNYELTRGGVSYTYLTCEHFASLYPDAERYLLIGADMLENFPEWKNPEEILKSFRLAACAREDIKPFLGYKEIVEQKFSADVRTLSYVGEKVSSTQIRTYAALGEDISRYVNPDVCQYIRRKGLYAMHGLWGVKQFLKPERWQHTLRVAVMCAKNSSRAGISEEQAITMAALHDVAKYMTPGKGYLKDFVCPDGVPDPVVHQYSGAYVAEKVFGVKDRVVLEAIACHTSGREDMTAADALLYLSDMLEEGRKFDGVDELRKIFKEDLFRCLYAALKQQVEYLGATGKPVYGLTLKAYQSIKEKTNDK